MTDPGVARQVHEADLKDRFPHDRVVFFCDAVFAIAITLLAIELKLPDNDSLARLGAQAWSELPALFVSYVISFLVTGLFWAGHMQTWRHVRQVSGKLVWTTLLQMMFVALMPFATREYSVYFNSSNSPGRLAFYAFVLAGISLFALVSRRIVIAQEQLHERIGVAATRWLLWRGIIPLVLFVLAIPLAYVVPVWCGGLMFAMIFPCQAVVRRWILRTSVDAG